MPKILWGNITERQAIDKIVEVITELSESKRASEFVTAQDMKEPLRRFVKEKNPTTSDEQADFIASNIRGWLGSRYTMLSEISDYLNVEKMMTFIKNFERDGEPYKYRRRRMR